MKIFS